MVRNYANVVDLRFSPIWRLSVCVHIIQQKESMWDWNGSYWKRTNRLDFGENPSLERHTLEQTLFHSRYWIICITPLTSQFTGCAESRQSWAFAMDSRHRNPLLAMCWAVAWQCQDFSGKCLQIQLNFFHLLMVLASIILVVTTWKRTLPACSHLVFFFYIQNNVAKLRLERENSHQPFQENISIIAGLVTNVLPFC